jgi:hypothetical protein
MSSPSFSSSSSSSPFLVIHCELIKTSDKFFPLLATSRDNLRLWHN